MIGRRCGWLTGCWWWRRTGMRATAWPVCLPGYPVGLVALLRARRRSLRAREWGRPSMVMSDRGNAMKDSYPAG